MPTRFLMEIQHRKNGNIGRTVAPIRTALKNHSIRSSSKILKLGVGWHNDQPYIFMARCGVTGLMYIFLSECPVPGWCTELTEVSGTGIDVVPKLPKLPLQVWKSVPFPAVPVSMLYRIYRYVHWCCTALTEVSRTGIDIIPNLPKNPLPVMPAVCLCTYRAEHTSVRSNIQKIYNGIHWTFNNTKHFSIWPHKPREHLDEDINWVRGASCSSRHVGIARIAWVGVISSRLYVRLVSTYTSVYMYIIFVYRPYIGHWDT